MAQAIANGPRAADKVARLLLAAQTLEALRVIFGECLVVPANHAADLCLLSVNAAGGVMRCGNAPRDPIAQSAQRTELGGHHADDGARLTLELQDIQFRDAAMDPKIGRQADVGDGVAAEIERQT